VERDFLFTVEVWLLYGQPSCYVNTKQIIYVHNQTQQCICALLVTSFRHYCHHQANIVQKLKKGSYKRLYIIKPTRCTISQIYFILEQHSACFGRSFRSSSGVLRLYIQHHRFCGCLLASSHRTCTAGRTDHELSTTIPTIRRENVRIMFSCKQTSG
jgi:hypothetical protein